MLIFLFFLSGHKIHANKLYIYLTILTLSFVVFFVVVVRCTDDYVNIIDSTGENKLCGKERTVYKNELCSNVIYVVYVAPTEPFRPRDNRGFKLYYESM